MKISDLHMLCFTLFIEIESLRHNANERERQIDEVRRNSLIVINRCSLEK